MNPLDVVKWLAGLALALLLFFGGRACSDAANAGVIAEKNTALATAAGELRAAGASLGGCATSLTAVNDQTTRNQQAAAAQAGRAAAAVATAGEQRARYEARIAVIEGEIDAAKRRPECRAQLEMQVCTPFD